jgi:hypothetical protein
MTAEGAFRNDIKEKEAEPLSAATAIVVSNALKKRGWEINDSAFTNQALQGKEELKYLVGYIRARHQTLVRTINGKDVSKGSYSLGDRVVGMRAQAPADALVLVHADGHRLTKTAWVVSVAAWGALSGLTGASLEAMFNLLEKHVSLQISLVDSRTGEVLWYSEVSRAGEQQILKELRKVP